MENKKKFLTFEQLQSEKWYRLMKVVYIISVISLVIQTIFILWINYNQHGYFVWQHVVVALPGLLFLEIVRRAIYYIWIGKIFPTKNKN